MKSLIQRICQVDIANFRDLAEMLQMQNINLILTDNYFEAKLYPREYNDIISYNQAKHPEFRQIDL